MIGILQGKTNTIESKSADRTEGNKDTNKKPKVLTLNSFLSIGSGSPPSKMSGDLRNYFGTSPPPSKSSGNGESKQKNSKHLSKQALNEEKNKSEKPKNCEKPIAKKKEKASSNLKESNGEKVKDEISKKNGGKNINNSKKKKVVKELVPIPSVKDEGAIAEDANLSFVSFEDFVGDDKEKKVTKQEHKKKEKVKKEKQTWKQNNEKERNKKHNVPKETPRSDDNATQKNAEKLVHSQNNQVKKKSVKNLLLKDDVSFKTVVAEIHHHSPVSSKKCPNKSPQQKNPKRRSNVVVDSETGKICEIEVVQSDVQNNNQVQFHFESKNNSNKPFPIFQKRTEETSQVNKPVFSIFEKKSKKNDEDDKSLLEDEEKNNLKRKNVKLEKEKMPQKKRKKMDSMADTSMESVDDFKPLKEESINKTRKKLKKTNVNDVSPQKVRRSTRKTASSTPKKEFEVESAIRSDGTIRMRIRLKKTPGKCDVKTATASKLLKKAKGQSAKVMYANRLKTSPTKIKQRKLSGKQTIADIKEKRKVTENKKKQSTKDTGKQTTLNNKKTATTNNVASIFTKDGRKKASKVMKGVTSSSTDENNEIIKEKPILDEETLKARRAFLNKDTAMDNSKQTNGIINVNDLQEPPLPSISHVLQLDDNPLWNLPKVNLNIKSNDVNQICNRTWTNGLINLDQTMHNQYRIKDFSGHLQFTYETQRLLLNKLSLEYPTNPVRRIFKRYLSKYNGENVHCNKNKRNSKGHEDLKAKCKEEIGKQVKRKSAILEENEGRSKRRKVPNNEKSGNKSETNEEVRPTRRTRKKNVITDDDEKDETKECKKEEKKESKKEEVSDVKATTKPVGLLWTEKYQPSNMLELIGNRVNTKTLEIWLNEWKKISIKETIKIKKEKMKNGKISSQSGKDWWTQDNDSEFEFNDFDSGEDSEDDDYDDTLCNTKILVGPSGSGKTAAVYACAGELGFKVFEVNASNRRTGKQILSELGEATQSHHVARQSVSGPLASFLSIQGSPQKLSNPVKPKIGIQNFFKPAGNVDKQKGAKKQPKKVIELKKIEPVSDTEGQPLGTAKRITRTSLIFFKDVDIVFGEDKGFLSAINSLMETTKRPIIMTTSDQSVCDEFSSPSEYLEFKYPTVDQVAVNLQMICLAENVLANRFDLINLANLLNGDMRQCISTLHFWVESGASFNMLPGNAMMFIKNVYEAIETKEGGDEIKNVEKKMKEAGAMGDSDISLEVPKHAGCFESSIGVLNMKTNLKDMVDSLKHSIQNASDFCKQCDLISAFNKIGTCILQNNIHTLLARVHIKESKRTNSSDHNSDDGEHRNTDKDHKTDDVNKRLSSKTMDSFSELAENMSFMDVCNSFTGSQQKSTFNLLSQSSKVRTGQYNDPSMVNDHSFNITAAIQVASYHCCRRNLLDVENELKEQCIDTTSVDQGSDLLNEENQNFNQIICPKERERSFNEKSSTYNLVTRQLPLQTCGNQRILGMDYFPTVRNICKNEKFRKETQRKRRFLHYLDSNYIVLKENTHILLATSLQTNQQ
ncbi:uncharacterized protein [Antedon mediterranea]|uniref:uncharacterized protein n=1 Tax=Antedon mediterranea TaxID=105859 RepID=UPI003AF50D8F